MGMSFAATFEKLENKQERFTAALLAPAPMQARRLCHVTLHGFKECFPQMRLNRRVWVLHSQKRRGPFFLVVE